MKKSFWTPISIVIAVLRVGHFMELLLLSALLTQLSITESHERLSYLSIPELSSIVD